jgi:Tfp pilus assembly protein FimT
MIQNDSRAFTLIECLVIMAFFSFLLGIGMPSLYDIVQKRKADLRMHRLLGAIQFARSEAIKHDMTIILCASKDGQTCNGRWNEGQIVFVPESSALVSVAGDMPIKKILRVFSGFQHANLVWRGFRARHALLFAPLGLQKRANGRFIYSTKDGNQRFEREIVINRSGRARLLRSDEGF